MGPMGQAVRFSIWPPPPSHAVFPDFFFLAAHGRCGNPAAEYHHPPHDEVFPISWFWGHMGGAGVPLGNVYTPLPHAMHGFQQFANHLTTARQCFYRGSSRSGVPKRVRTPCSNCPQHPPSTMQFFPGAPYLGAIHNVNLGVPVGAVMAGVAHVFGGFGCAHNSHLAQNIGRGVHGAS